MAIRELFSQGHWDEMKRWRLLLRSDTQLPASSEFYSLPREYFDPVHKSGPLIRNLHWTLGNQTAKEAGQRHAYWMVDDSARPVADYSLVSVMDYFHDFMHPEKAGQTDVIPISFELFKAPILANGGSGLSGCSELLFFGVCEPDCKDAWNAQTPELAIAFLTTMSPSSETMFVTAVWGEDRLKELWQATSEIVTHRFPDPLLY